MSMIIPWMIDLLSLQAAHQPTFGHPPSYSRLIPRWNHGPSLQAHTSLEKTLIDAGYGDEAALRDRLSAHGLIYAVGIRPATAVWWEAHRPARAPAKAGRGRPRTRVL